MEIKDGWELGRRIVCSRIRTIQQNMLTWVLIEEFKIIMETKIITRSNFERSNIPTFLLPSKSLQPVHNSPWTPKIGGHAIITPLIKQAVTFTSLCCVNGYSYKIKKRSPLYWNPMIKIEPLTEPILLPFNSILTTF